MLKQSNIIISDKGNSSLHIDIHLNESFPSKGTVVFLHGFKGFKDWGVFPFLPQKFEHSQYSWVSVNFSHNGVSPANNFEFTNLDAFAFNTFSQVLDEIDEVLDFLKSHAIQYRLNLNNVILFGHSRGAAQAINYAISHQVQAVVAWAPVSDLGNLFRNFNLDQWEREKFVFIANQRTGQQMPLSFEMYQDYLKNRDRLNPVLSIAKLNIPVLLVHGQNDTSVPVSNSILLHQNNNRSQLVIVENADHVFQSKHPWPVDAEFPLQLQNAISATLDFLQKIGGESANVNR